MLGRLVLSTVAVIAKDLLSKTFREPSLHKCRRHLLCTRRGGQQNICYTGRQSYVSDQDNDDNHCTCVLWQYTQNHRDKRILRRSMIVREFLQEEQTGCKERWWWGKWETGQKALSSWSVFRQPCQDDRVCSWLTTFDQARKCWVQMTIQQLKIKLESF